MQTLGKEGRCMWLDTPKRRLLKEAVGELMLTDKKQWGGRGVENVRSLIFRSSPSSWWAPGALFVIRLPLDLRILTLSAPSTGNKVSVVILTCERVSRDRE